MAADGSIGGFSGQWGEGSKIDKKRSLLQSEGVQFDAKTGKIAKECLLGSIPSAATFDDDDDDNLDSRKQDAKTTSARPTKKQKAEKSVDDNTTSKYFAVTKKKKADGSKESWSDATNNVDIELRDITLQMISERAAGKTC